MSISNSRNFQNVCAQLADQVLVRAHLSKRSAIKSLYLYSDSAFEIDLSIISISIFLARSKIWKLQSPIMNVTVSASAMRDVQIDWYNLVQ